VSNTLPSVYDLVYLKIGVFASYPSKDPFNDEWAYTYAEILHYQIDSLK